MEPRTRHLVAVFEDERAARSAATTLSDAGIDRERIHVGDGANARSALVAEMRSETDESWFMPQAGFLLNKEAAKGFALGVPAFAAIGAVVVLPLGFFVLESLAVWTRLLTLAVLGAVAGGAGGAIVGAGEAEKGAQKPLAAERGVALRVDGAGGDPDIRRLLADAQPIRVDLVSDRGPSGAVVEEDERTGEGVKEHLRTAWRDGGGRAR